MEFGYHRKEAVPRGPSCVLALPNKPAEFKIRRFPDWLNGLRRCTLWGRVGPY